MLEVFKLEITIGLKGDVKPIKKSANRVKALFFTQIAFCNFAFGFGRFIAVIAFEAVFVFRAKGLVSIKNVLPRLGGEDAEEMIANWLLSRGLQQHKVTPTANIANWRRLGSFMLA